MRKPLVKQALREARKSHEPVTVSSIATVAGVSTDFIYRHDELRPQVEALRRARASSGAPALVNDPDIAAADSTLVRRLSQQLADARRRHREEVAELHRALETRKVRWFCSRRRVADGSRSEASHTRQSD
ncbi:hypothetical protein AB0K15_28945 [Amycolatopsis sp. NPDC049253]|uniref:hypothetical protein n=1 Tax=Amycolatopsis sp. NPDC049253 TaxID=3155274 RepID=UPI00342418D5